MPSVAEEPPFYGGVRANAHHGVSVASKKRRWEDAKSSSDANHNSDAVVSLILDGDDLLSHKLAAAAAAATSTGRSSMGTAPQRKIISLANKRRRFSNCDNTLDDRPKPLTSSSSSATIHASSAMLPCHVCQRKPRRKSDLDSQADCEGCGQRACFVCLRECSGWTANSNSNSDNNTSDCEGQTPTEETSGRGLCHLSKRPQSKPWSASRRGHRRIVCSRCCVERGEDGEAVCLGCMAA